MALQEHLRWWRVEDDKVCHIGPPNNPYRYDVNTEAPDAEVNIAALLALPAALELAAFIVGLDDEEAGCERWEEVAEAAREVIRVKDGGAP